MVIYILENYIYIVVDIPWYHNEWGHIDIEKIAFGLHNKNQFKLNNIIIYAKIFLLNNKC